MVVVVRRHPHRMNSVLPQAKPTEVGWCAPGRSCIYANRLTLIGHLIAPADSLWALGRGNGQRDGEPGAAAGLALDGDAAAEEGNKPVGGGEPETDTLEGAG